MVVGLFVIIILAHKGIKAAVILGMLVASIVYWAGEAIFLDVNPFASLAGASFIPPVKDMVNVTLFKFSFSGFAQIGWFTMITLIITFCIIDMFDTIGTLVGTASRAGMVDGEECAKMCHEDGYYHVASHDYGGQTRPQSSYNHDGRNEFCCQ